MNNKIICMGIISLFLLTGFITASALDMSTTQVTSLSKTIYVDDDNTNGPWDGTKEQPYQHIQDGVDNADPGDTIYVYSGTYVENVEIRRAYITLQGENKENTIIDLNNPEKGKGVHIYYANNVKISGFTITDAYVAIHIDYSLGNTITDNILSTQNCSVALWESDDNTISDNTMISDWVGMYIYHSYWNSIHDNIISNSCYGMHLYSSNGNSIRGNTISNHIVGINIVESAGYNRMSLLLSNTFKNNGDNIVGLTKAKSISPFFLIERFMDHFPLLARLLKL